ncbi:DUF6461 domain-containing protein [Streptomyces sp. CBMA156]|uniref:DUF6461 domain-containing protein n=1 Tax=Streptomyces sp. CBMA156 TaxID=1930280 RepID=UPI0016621AFC|nr:DUF6461 domain-containing protein [Streptomyces sp. CBMA156]MBD0675616.1 hypothetical protein [Streptomyces sp. CBMA156]
MTAHATGFTWFEARYPDLAEAYCLTQVQGLTPDELLRRFDALPGSDAVGLEAVTVRSEAYEDGEDAEAGALFDPAEDRLLVAVTELDGWALAIEPYGYLGVLDTVIPRLGEGTRLVSHFRDVNAADHFHWWEHGTRRLHFEPLFPDQRDGTDAEAPGIPELLTACGFELETEEHDLCGEAAFALAERLTDARLSPERLEAATYRIGYAPRP